MEKENESIELFQFLKDLADRETSLINLNKKQQLKFIKGLIDELIDPGIATDSLKRIKRIALEARAKLKNISSGRINLNYQGEGNYEIATKQIRSYRKELKGIIEECEIRLNNRAERETVDLDYIVKEPILLNVHEYFTDKWGLEIGKEDFKKLFCLNIEPVVFPRIKGRGGVQSFCYFLSLLKDSRSLDLTDEQINKRFNISYKQTMQRVSKDDEKLERQKKVNTVTRREIKKILNSLMEVQVI